MASHLLTLQDVLGVHTTDRARAAIATATMRLATTVEVVAANRASPTLTFASAGYVYNVTN